MVFNISKNRLQKWISDVLDSVCDPWLKVQKFSFSSQDRQWDSEVIIIPVGQGNKTLLDDLSDIEDSWKVDGVLFFVFTLIKLADWTDNKILVSLPQTFQKSDVIGMVLQENGEDLREKFIQQSLSLSRPDLT